MNTDAIVYIVDDDVAIRSALSLLMESVGLKAVSCESAYAFLDGYDPNLPGCLLLDIRMKGMSGLELQLRLKEMGIQLPVIIMTGHGDVSMAVRALKSGAIDFIEKPFENKRLIGKVKTELKNEIERHKQKSVDEIILRRLQRLSPREREIMTLLVEGKSNKVIAAELEISIRTVENHRAKIMDKAGAGSFSQLIHYSLLEKSLQA